MWEEGYEGGEDEACVPAQGLQCEHRHSDVQEHKVLRQKVGQLKQLQQTWRRWVSQVFRSVFWVAFSGQQSVPNKALPASALFLSLLISPHLNSVCMCVCVRVRACWSWSAMTDFARVVSIWAVRLLKVWRYLVRHFTCLVLSLGLTGCCGCSDSYWIRLELSDILPVRLCLWVWQVVVGVVTVTELDSSCLTFYLFGSVFGLWWQVVEGVVGLGDPTKQHSNNTCMEQQNHWPRHQPSPQQYLHGTTEPLTKAPTTPTTIPAWNNRTTDQGTNHPHNNTCMEHNHWPRHQPPPQQYLHGTQPLTKAQPPPQQYLHGTQPLTKAPATPTTIPAWNTTTDQGTNHPHNNTCVEHNHWPRHQPPPQYLHGTRPLTKAPTTPTTTIPAWNYTTIPAWNTTTDQCTKCHPLNKTNVSISNASQLFTQYRGALLNRI